MKGFFGRLMGLEKCMICKKKPVRPQYYLDDEDNRKPVCYKCVSYAERRGLSEDVVVLK
ncbi:hypothetical protein [Pseudalkalibacillus hwajinpoensis]|uniref:hypothetical protein n=1 Tax=Guptibacillus hwajinpoensis TaxID=208199 RepID=UPI00192947D2|nr:hypothetical protein [Pseudalkalibacillus hwajinpoensis]